MDIIQSIKNEAKRQGLGVTGLAEKMETSQPALSRMLNADSIKFSVVQKIASILDVEVSYLIGEHKNPTNQQNTNSPNSQQVAGNGNKITNKNVGHNLQFSGKTVKENNVSINDCFDLVEEKERIISELDAALKSKDIIIADGSSALKEKDAVIKEKDEYIKKITSESFLRNEKKDEQINKLLEQLAEKDRHITNLIDKLK
ncbi:hypothetical protein FACS189434_09130 [Bacteroidia bacterium]|nr:hypothetical protein FACS189434_09130 [Bacteroidia bacterium]